MDPNVLISARISPEGTTARVLEAAEEGRYELIISEHVLDEVGDVLSRPKMRRYLDAEAVPGYLDRVREAAEVVEDPMESDVVGTTQDPDDDYLAGLAAVNRADFLVSGDRHLLDLVQIPGAQGVPVVRVLSPAPFLKELE